MESEKFKCKFKPVSREGLYILVIIAMIASCEAKSVISRVEDKIDKLEKKIELIIENIGSPKIKDWEREE